MRIQWYCNAESQWNLASVSVTLAEIFLNRLGLTLELEKEFLVIHSCYDSHDIGNMS